MRLAAILLLILGAGDVAMAASDPCAKFADADAYNYCLAGAGPVARQRVLSRAPDNEPAAHSRRISLPATAKRAALRLPPGVVQKPAPRGRVRVQIILR